MLKRDIRELKATITYQITYLFQLYIVDFESVSIFLLLKQKMKSDITVDVFKLEDKCNIIFLFISSHRYC